MTATLQRTWTQVGEAVLDDLLDERKREISRERVARLIEKLEWQDVEGSLEVAFMPGQAIKTLIRELRIPHVTRIAISSALAPYGFYGIDAEYRNGRARIYALDEGSAVTVIASDFEPEDGDDGDSV